jgi:hypothetical protein
MENKRRNVRVAFVDEMTMLKPQDLQHGNLCLQQVKGCNQIFGGIVVALVGDTAQLPPAIVLPANGTSATANATKRPKNF